MLERKIGFSVSNISYYVVDILVFFWLKYASGALQYVILLFLCYMTSENKIKKLEIVDFDFLIILSRKLN